jgi:hypothetical protein
MSANRWALAVTIVTLAAHASLAALDTDISDADIRRAIEVAIGSDTVREQFHARYRIAVQDATVEALEVITEFRRFVLASEEQLASGNWMVARGGYDANGRTLKQMLEGSKGRVSIKARLRFHPHHSYASLPGAEILLGDPSYLAIDHVTTPLIGWSEVGVSAGLTGSVLEVSFNAPSIEDRVLPVGIVFDGKEILRTTVDFSRLN